MHELGVLMQITRTVNSVAVQNRIRRVRQISLEVGEASGYVHQYLTRLFPAAADPYPALRKAKLVIHTVAGKGLVIRDIGY